MTKIACVEEFCCHTSSAALQDDSSFLPKQITEIAHFFSTGLFAHFKLYHFLFTQPQAHHEQNIMLQVSVHLLRAAVAWGRPHYIADYHCKSLQLGANVCVRRAYHHTSAKAGNQLWCQAGFLIGLTVTHSFANHQDHMLMCCEMQPGAFRVAD